MALLQVESLSAARRLLRTFPSAPDARRQARLIHRALAHGAWPASRNDELEAFAAWLDGAPPIETLQARCAELVGALSSGPVRPRPTGSRRLQVP